MGRFVVRNIGGTSLRKCSHGSWLNHWRHETRSRRLRCATLRCQNLAEVGAHVHELTSNRGSNWRQWIVPLCKSCNNSRQDLELEGHVALVSANTQSMRCY